MAFLMLKKSGTIAGCKNSGACGTPIASLASVLSRPWRASSVIPKPGSSASSGREKNGLRYLRTRPSRLVRPEDSASARPALRGDANLPGSGDPARLLQELWQGEAGKSGLAGRQPVRHQALRLLRGTTLPGHDDQGCGGGNAAGLEDDQSPRCSVYARAAAASGQAGAEGHRGRRDIDPKGTHVPDRGQRPGAAAADLVRRQGSLGREHGRVLQVAGPDEEQEYAWR